MNDDYDQASEVADERVVHGLLLSLAVDSEEANNRRIERLLLRLQQDASRGTSPSLPGTPLVQGRSNLKWLAVTGVMAASLVLGMSLWRRPPAKQGAEARLLVHGAGVQLFGVGGDLLSFPIPGQTADLISGQTIQTPRTIDSAEIVYEDGTKVELSGDTTVTLARTKHGAKGIYVVSGLIQADVSPQPPDLPLLIRTSTATLEVLGTSLGVDVDDSSTQLEVASGLVSMTRRSDGERIEVAAGQLATVTEASGIPFNSKTFPSLPYAWSVDFEEGLPSGWWAGQRIETETGWAVLAAGDGHGRENNIAVTTQNAWREGQHGLFNLSDDSVLHVRFRQQRVAPLRLMLVTRAYPPGNGRRGVNLYYEDSSWNAHLASKTWHTISVPLSETSYFGKRGNFENGKQKLEGLAAFTVQFTSMNQEIGLTVDRIWVTR
ncbi:FecR domain-containing protein [Roseiconus nitratireducens]|nr:FecR family protein [Roseiconus nitratireducens]